MSEEIKESEPLKLYNSECTYLLSVEQEIQQHQARLNVLIPAQKECVAQIEARLGLPVGGLAAFNISADGVLTKRNGTKPPAGTNGSIARKVAARSRKKR